MTEQDEALHRPWLAAALTGGVAALLAVAFLRVHREDATLPAIAHQALEAALPVWKTTEPVNEIVYGTRGFDTFGETFLLLAAVDAVTVPARGREHRHEYLGEAAAAQAEQARVDPKRPPGSKQARAAERAEASGSNRPADRMRLGTSGLELASEMTVIVRISAAARVGAVRARRAGPA